MIAHKNSLKDSLLKNLSLSIIFISLLAGIGYGLFHKGFWLDRFRSTNTIALSPKDGVDTTMMKELRLSGSSRLIFPDLKKHLSDIDGPIYIIDLTGGEEKYYHEYSAGFFKAHGGRANVVHLLRRLLLTGSIRIDPILLMDEEQLVKKHGFLYKTFPIVRKSPPDQKTMDDIINFIENLDENAWLHVHCFAGKGRTTMFMIMVDIIKNGDKVPLQEIVKRQHLLGGINLFDTARWTTGSYTQEELENRKAFIIRFHKYVMERKTK